MTAGRCSGPASPDLLAGIELFNRREFFACHEVLEELWRAELDPVRRLYQGILQIGVGFYHLGRGNRVGALRQLDKGISRVEVFLPRCLRVDTAGLVSGARACRELVAALGPDALARFDWSRVPIIAVDHPAQP